MPKLAKRFNVAPSKMIVCKEESVQNVSLAFVCHIGNKFEWKKMKVESGHKIRKVGQMIIDCDFFCKNLREYWSESKIKALLKNASQA